MFKRVIGWLIMTVGFSALFVVLGFEDTIFILVVTILYVLLVHVKRLEPPPARTIMVPSKECHICGKPRALEDLVPVVGSKEFSTGLFEWKLYVCRDNQVCKDKALVEVKEIVQAEEQRRKNIKA